jgi:hypothetical protein
LEKRGEVVYQLELPPQLSDVHEEQIPMEDLDAKEDLSYQEHPVCVCPKNKYPWKIVIPRF